MKHITTPLIVADDYPLQPMKTIQMQLKMKKIIHDLLIMSALLMLWLCSERVLAENQSDTESESGARYSSLWLRSADGTENQAADMLSTKVEMSIAGPILRATVKQTFRNSSQSWLEGIYSFPLPEQAAVDQLRMRVGERVIQGEIQEKQAALKTYQQAKQNGQRASLLKQHRTNIFTTSLANIGPGEAIDVEFEYQQVLDFRDQQYSLRFPMVSTPQFTPEHVVQQKDFVAPVNLIRQPGEAAGNPLEITIDLLPGFPIERPASISHPVSVTELVSDRYQIHLAGSAELSNRDFLLSWKLKPSAEPMVSIMREDHEGESYGLMMVMPPQAAPEEIQAQPRELIWVLDVSGSMQGESIEQARSAILKAVSRLRPEDYFNVIFFNTRAWSLFPHPRTGTQDNLNMARQKLLQQEADGGTDMLPALKLALDKHTYSESLRQVIFVTDGAVGNEAELFAEIQNRLADSRLFTVGIGSAPNSYFMRKAALAGRGSFTYISQPQEVNLKIDRLLRKLESPALTDLGFDINDPMAEVLPTSLPDLYLGEPLYISFKAADFPKYAELTGTLKGLPSSLRIALDNQVQHPGVAVEWARRKIADLVDQYQQTQGEEQTSLREQALSIALAHHQVSKFTSLVAVDQIAERLGEELNTRHIPANAPKGWVKTTSSSKQGIRLAQTATDNPFKLLSGALFLMVACLLYATGTALRKRAKCA